MPTLDDLRPRTGSRLTCSSSVWASGRASRFAQTVLFLALSLSVVQSSAAQIALDMAHEQVAVSVTDRFVAGKTAVADWQSSQAQIEFDGVVAQGFSSAESLSGSVRIQRAGTWSPWHPLYIVRSVTDDAFLAGYYGDEVFANARVEIHFEEEGPRTHDINVIAAGVFDRRLDELAPEDRPGALAKSAAFANGPSTVVPPTLVTRTEWNASAFIGTPSPLSSSAYSNMTFHHAAGFTATTLEDGKAQVKAIQDFHQNGRGWSDIGYQFVIDRGGNVYQGRPFLDNSTTLEAVPELSLGAHVGGANTGNIGICLLGCYHPPEGSSCVDQITTEALDSYITMFAYLGEAYNIPVNSETLKGHRDFSATSCPGDNNYALLPSIRTEAVQLQQFGSARPDDFFIEPNAPNPFTGETTVRYYLQQDGQVNVTVYDLAGRVVAHLVDSFQEGPRWYRTTFDATDLPAGLYFYQVRVDGFSGEIFRDARALVHVK